MINFFQFETKNTFWMFSTKLNVFSSRNNLENILKNVFKIILLEKIAMFTNIMSQCPCQKLKLHKKKDQEIRKPPTGHYLKLN